MAHEHDLHARLDDLHDYLEARFDHIVQTQYRTNEHLERLNGRVYESAQKIATLEGKQAEAEQSVKRQRQTLTWGGAVAALGALCELARRFFQQGPTP